MWYLLDHDALSIPVRHARIEKQKKKRKKKEVMRRAFKTNHLPEAALKQTLTASPLTSPLTLGPRGSFKTHYPMVCSLQSPYVRSLQSPSNPQAPAKGRECVQTINALTPIPRLLLRILLLLAVCTSVDLLRPPKAGVSVHCFPPMGHDSWTP